MKKITFILFFSIVLLHSRENPFFPVSTEIEEPAEKIEQIPVAKRNNEVVQTKKQKKTFETPIVQIERKASTDEEKKVKKDSVSETVNFQYLRIVVSENKIRIETNDTLKNHFVADNPKVIIINFHRDVSFSTKKHQFDIAPFYEVRLGAHKNYYSFVVELNDAHKYQLDKKQYGYQLTVNDKQAISK